MKKCTKCKKDQNLDMFHKDSKTRDGLKHMCKECQSIKDRKLVYQEIVAFDFYE